MHITNPEGGVGPYEVTFGQADQIERRIASEVPRVPGMPRTIVVEALGPGRVNLSVEPLVESVPGRRHSESDTPVLPDDVQEQIREIIRQELAN